MAGHRAPNERRSLGPVSRRAAVVLAVVVATLVAATGGALAYWSTVGSGSGQAKTGTLLPPTAVSATSAAPGSVAVSWTASASGYAGIGYYVTRYQGATPTLICGTPANPTATSPCADSVTPGSGPYTYTVTAVFRSWTAVSNASAPVTAQKAPQTVSFTSQAPAGATVGGPTYAVTATGGGSGNPVTFTIDASAAAGCSINGAVVSFSAVGTCVINANQAGNSTYLAAPQAQQSFAVGKGSQAITFTSTPPSSPTVGGTYPVTATGGASGNPVTFSSATTAVCTVSGSTVTFVGAGSCTINADQAGNANYNPAPRVSQTFAVASAVTGIAWTGAGITCTGMGSANAVCSISVANNASFSGNVMFVDANGNPIVYSTTSDATIDVKETGKSTSQGTLTILKGTTTSSSAYQSAPKNGSNKQTLTATFKIGSTTYTATLTG